MTTFTRLTVLGSVRRAELVVPDDASIGGLMPRLLELLAEPTSSAARPLALVRTTGEQVDANQSAAEQLLADGELLRLVRAEDVPPPPEVADVTDVVGESYAGRAGLWSDRPREAAAAVAIGTLSCVVLLVGAPARPLLAGTVLVLLTLAAAAAGRLPVLSPHVRRWSATALTAAAIGAAWPTARTLPRPASYPGPEPVVALTVALIWVALALGIGVGHRSRAALAGGAVGLGLMLLPIVLVLGRVGPVHALAVGAAACTIALGLLPWYALTSSGLTGLDDQVLAGRPGRRDAVVRTADEAYRSLSWATFGVALPLMGTAAVLVTAPGPWPLALGLLVAVVAVLRTRAFPLAVQQLPLWAAGLVVVVTALVQVRPGGLHDTVLALVALAAAIAVAAGARPPAHVRAGWRRAGNLLETVAVIAMVPLILGTFGVFHDLLQAFR